MQIIISHVNTDFDALASMFAAKKIYPHAKVVISNKQNTQVKQFLTIYRDVLDTVQDNTVDWSAVTEIILVDVASLSRIGNAANKIDKENIRITVYDHHPRTDQNVNSDFEIIDLIGATVTILIEEIRRRDIPISSFEATLFGLGIYTDTGSFTYKSTTKRDFEAASFLMENGMNIDMIQHFSDLALLPEQQELLNQLFSKVQTYETDGLEIAISSYQTESFLPGLAAVTEKLLDIIGADVVLTIVKMKKHIYVVGRGSANRITLLPLLKKLGGGGHEQAGSATIKNADFSSTVEQITNNLDLILKPAITARDMMASPVKTLLPETKIEEAGHLMYRYGHSGFPVVENEKLVGMITRRDLDKANHHGLGHAPVKAYMSTNLVTIEPDTTIEEIQKLVIEHNLGRLPVIENDNIIGIITRTNIIELIHAQQEVENQKEPVQENLQATMKKQLPQEIYSLLEDISKTADKEDVAVYLIGGIVRDIFLKQPNDDVDIVIEGDGIAFAKKLQEDYGGEVVIHKSFGTATWESTSELQIDVTSARLEYYDRPASLPDVELSTLQEDLYRRDFTINAMAIQLNSQLFGQLVDPFHGREDLRNKNIRVLHNLSFIEDPTRILRGVRFETRFNFSMDNQTEQLALHSIDRITNLSAKRIINELKRLFMEDNPSHAIQRLYELQFWQQFGVENKALQDSITHIKNLDTLYEKYPNLEKNRTENWFDYLVIPFYQSDNLKAAEHFALTRPHIKYLQDILALVIDKGWKQATQRGDLQRYFKHHSDGAILFVMAADNKVLNEEMLISYLEMRLELPTLLTGEDLMEAGLKPGAVFSEILLDLEVAILNETVTTREDALTWLEKKVTN